VEGQFVLSNFLCPDELVAGLPQDMVDSVIKHRATIRIKR